jgi:hypothetical protein
MIYEEWEDLDSRDLSTIYLSLEDDFMFNIIREERIVGLCRVLESLHMTKPLTNQIFLKRQLYVLRIKECIIFLDHLNIFNT